MDTLIPLIQKFYTVLGLNLIPNSGDVIGFLAIFFLLSVSLIFLLKKDSFLEQDDLKPTSEVAQEVQGPEKESIPEPVIKKEELLAKRTWSERLKKGLSRSHEEVWGKITDVFQSPEGPSEEERERIEELLYSSDLGPRVVTELLDLIEEKVKNEGLSSEDFKKFLYQFLKSKMTSVQESLDFDLINFDSEKKGQMTKVIMIVGVNGAGKTTTIGKLATKLTQQGAKVVVGACDTFRAAAVDQLEVWCDRASATMVRAKEGAGPSGVGYETLELALSQKADYCILDTAGRLHTKDNLMMELKKSKNVLKKLDPEAPHHTILVIDAITGQNAIAQALEFHKTLDLSGLILTKCDGSSKAGSAVAILDQLKVPISYIGVGEDVEDLDIFDLDEYLKALLDIS